MNDQVYHIYRKDNGRYITKTTSMYVLKCYSPEFYTVVIEG
jgi:hypothetical protein